MHRSRCAQVSPHLAGPTAVRDRAYGPHGRAGRARQPAAAPRFEKSVEVCARGRGERRYIHRSTPVVRGRTEHCALRDVARGAMRCQMQENAKRATGFRGWRARGAEARVPPDDDSPKTTLRAARRGVARTRKCAAVSPQQRRLACAQAGGDAGPLARHVCRASRSPGSLLRLASIKEARTRERAAYRRAHRGAPLARCGREHCAASGGCAATDRGRCRSDGGAVNGTKEKATGPRQPRGRRHATHTARVLRRGRHVCKRGKTGIRQVYREECTRV